MKKFFIAAVLLNLTLTAFSQDQTPVAYLNGITKSLNDVSKKYMEYMSATSHGASVRKAGKKRQDLLTQIDKSRGDIVGLGYYKGDKSLHQATNEYLKLMTSSMNEDYAKMVNLEEIAEQSYDNMEAYILLKEKVAERMDEASNKMTVNEQEFCKKYNINLVSAETSQSLKMKEMGEVIDYYNDIYLIFFKCNAQETDMMEALNKKNVTAMEQLKGAMVKYADEGLSKLDTFQAYKGDNSLKTACRNALMFYKKEGEKMGAYTDFYMKETAFEQVKKSFESNPSFKSNKTEIDKYNKAVKEMNEGSNSYNKTNAELNQQRTNMYNNWNEAGKQFLDKNMPYAG
jgi:hypothetical protein